MRVVLADAIPDLKEIQQLVPASVTIRRTSEEDLKSRQVHIWTVRRMDS